MTVPTLPDELLTLTFDLLSQTDLYHSALVSKTFLAIVKPLLYSCIVIKTKSQVGKLKDADEEDKSRIESVVFAGNSSVMNNAGFDDLMSIFAVKDAEKIGGATDGCVGDIFEGLVFPLRSTYFSLALLQLKTLKCNVLS